MGGLLAAVSTVSSLVFASTLGLLYGLGAAVTVTIVVGSALYGVRQKTAHEAAKDAASAWKEERDAARDKVERLEARLQERLSRQDISNLERLTESHHRDLTANNRELVAILSAVKDTLQILAARGN